MAHRIPTEITQNILKYAISVPLFFETDPITSFGIDELPFYNDERPYWRSERTRNRLRRVCSSWNDYLRRFDRRYVRLFDIWCGKVESSALQTAFRINSEYEPRFVVNAPTVPNSPLDGMSNPRSLASATDPLSLITEELQKGLLWKLEVLTGPYCDKLLREPALLEMCPNLSAMAQGRSISDKVPALLASRFKTFFPQLLPSQLDAKLMVPSLTTLRLAISDEGTSKQSALPKLPNLRYLRIRYGIGDKYELLIHILQNVGCNLTVFYCGSSDDEVFDEGLWELIPRVTHLQLPQWGALQPPEWHPLQKIRVNVEYVARMTFIRPTEPGVNVVLPEILPSWVARDVAANHQEILQRRRYTIQIHDAWSACLWPRKRQPRIGTFIKTIFSLADYCQRIGVVLVDLLGFTFYEYIVYCIDRLWKRRRLEPWMFKPFHSRVDILDF